MLRSHGSVALEGLPDAASVVSRRGRQGPAPTPQTERLNVRIKTRGFAPMQLFVRRGLLFFFLLAVLAPATAQPSQQEDRVQVGDEAIDFTMQSIDGETFALSDVRGEKNVVVIFFRGTW